MIGVIVVKDLAINTHSYWANNDLNEDLYKNPYDTEYEKFILELRNLMIPIFDSIKKYGSKKVHFNKFIKRRDVFYKRIILNESYISEITVKYYIKHG